MDYPQYQYNPLRRYREIRLLCLLPAREDDPLRCALRHVDIENAPSYSAISYVWGCQSASEVLLVDEAPLFRALKITRSLFLALKDIRALYCKDQEQLLWADGVCIQQSDLHERAQQVSIMNIIYQRASRVLTYTGPDAGSSRKALDFIQELGEHIRECGSERAALGFPLVNDPRWTVLHEFFQRPWPSRLWIVQEFLLSQSPPILLCGRREVSWNLILELVLLAHDGYLPFVVRHSDTDPASSLLWLGELRVAVSDASTRKGMTLMELLRACRARHCVDTRDKIFAVLSLASDAEELQIRADYNISTRELYTKVAATIIQNAQSLEILGSAGHQKQSDLPSWVPNWTTDRVTVPLDINDFLFVKNAKTSTYMFSAGGEREFGTTINAGAYSGVLSFRGMIVDQISCLTEVICAKTRTQDHSWMAWLQNTMEAFDTSKYGKEGAMEMAFWQTMCGGRTHDRQKISKEYKPRYSAWKDHISTGKEKALSKFAEQFLRALRRGIHLRCLCRTTGGFIGLVSSHAREGDKVCVVRGTRVPLLLRPCGEFWLFIGECYIHGIMDGEALQFHGFQTQDVKVV